MRTFSFYLVLLFCLMQTIEGQAQNTSFLNPSDLRLLNNAGFVGNFESNDYYYKAYINTQQSFAYNTKFNNLHWNNYLAANRRLPIGRSDWIGLGGYFLSTLEHHPILNRFADQQEFALGASYVKVISNRRSKLEHKLTLGSLIEVNHYDIFFDSRSWDSKLNFGLFWDASPSIRSYSANAHNFGVSLQNFHFLRDSNPLLDPFLIKLHSQHGYSVKKVPLSYELQLYADISAPIKNLAQLHAAHLSYNTSLSLFLWKSRSELKYMLAVQYGVSDIEQDRYLGGALGININKLSIKLQYHKSLSTPTLHYSGLYIQYQFRKRQVGGVPTF